MRVQNGDVRERWRYWETNHQRNAYFYQFIWPFNKIEEMKIRVEE